MAHDLVVVDLSHHNTVYSFGDAKAAGLIGVIHKATEGTTFVDENYAERREQAVAAGLLWASYHFLRHGDVSAQMAHYLDVVDPAAGERVVIDHEHEDVTLDDLRQAVSILLDDSRHLQVTVYSGHTIKEQLGGGYDELLAQTSLWIAQYTSGDPSWPNGTWPVWTLFQYSDGASGGSPKSIAGIGTPHDCNAFNGSRENCAKWMAPAEAPGPAPGPEPEAEPVLVAITVPEGSAGVIVTINGDVIVSP